MRRSCRRPGRRCWFSPTTRAWQTARPRWCSWPASSRTPSPRGRCCRRSRGSSRCSTRPAPTPRKRCRRPTPTPSCGTSVMRRWPRPPTTWACTPSDFLYARVDIIGGHDDPQLLELEMVEPSLGWRQLDEQHPRTAAAPVRARGGVSPRAAGPRSALASTPIARRCAAVHAAAPATCTATSAAGTPVKNCTIPTHALCAHQRDQHDEPFAHRLRRVHGRQPETQPDQQRQVEPQQRRVRVHQRGDLHLKAGHRAVDALVAGVRPGAGHQRSGHQYGRQHRGTEKGQRRAAPSAPRSRGTPASGSPILT